MTYELVIEPCSIPISEADRDRNPKPAGAGAGDGDPVIAELLGEGEMDELAVVAGFERESASQGERGRGRGFYPIIEGLKRAAEKRNAAKASANQREDALSALFGRGAPA